MHKVVGGGFEGRKARLGGHELQTGVSHGAIDGQTEHGCRSVRMPSKAGSGEQLLGGPELWREEVKVKKKLGPLCRRVNSDPRPLAAK